MKFNPLASSSQSLAAQLVAMFNKGLGLDNLSEAVAKLFDDLSQKAADLDQKAADLDQKIADLDQKITDLKTDSETELEAAVPVGSVHHFPRTVPPIGFIEANGALLLRVDYPALWDEAQNSGNIVADASWGPDNIGCYSYGDGSTTFRIPDIRGRVPIGANQGSGLTDRPLGSVGGEESHALITTEIPGHNHIQGSTAYGGHPYGTTPVAGANFGLSNQDTSSNTGIYTSSTGGDNAHNNMPPYVSLLVCIKT